MNEKIIFLFASHSGFYLGFNLLAFFLRSLTEVNLNLLFPALIVQILVLTIFALIVWGCKTGFVPSEVAEEKAAQYAESWIGAAIVGTITGWLT